jgi:EmrB/QacA subfamily drug resistance transporter
MSDRKIAADAAGAGDPVAAPPAEREPVPLRRAEVHRIMTALMFAMFLGALDQTIVATALPSIGRSFGDIENLSWIITAYLLTATAFTPLYGKLSDIHGRRAIMLIGIGLFGAGSLICALAPNMATLILGRAVQAAGGGGIMSLAHTVIADVATPLERGRYQGYISGVFGFASVGGPILGGIIAQYFHWSLIFWIYIPFTVLAFFIINKEFKRLPRHDRPHRLDVLGAVLMMAAAIAMLLALNWGGTRYAWTSPTILSLIAGSAMLWFLFVVRLMTAPEPFLPLAMLGNPIVRFAAIGNACCNGTMIGLTVFTPVFFDGVLKLPPSAAGLALIPLMLGGTFSSIVIGWVVMRMRHYKRLPIAGMGIIFACLVGMAIAPASLSAWGMAAVLGVVGCGFGMAMPVTTVSLQNAVVPHQMGIATGAMNFCRSLTASIVVAVLGAILLSGLDSAGTGGSIAAMARGTPADLAPIFRWIFAALAGVMLVGLTVVHLMEERPLRGPAAAKATPAPQPAE